MGDNLKKHISFNLFLAAIAFSAAAADLDWQNRPGYRFAPLSVPKAGKPGFTLMAPDQTGVHFTNVLSETRAAENQIRLNGSGLALGDVDGDGLPDIYLCGLENRNVLYRNLGNWQFQEVTDQAGVGCDGQFSTGAALADVDGDGDLDLLVNGIGTGTRLFLNDGKGHFTESNTSGLLRKYGATTLALADIDGDGDLDLYVANYRTDTVRSTGYFLLKSGNRTMIRPEDSDRLEMTPDGRVFELGEPDVLYLNDGHGHFTPASWTDGRFRDTQGNPLKQAPLDWGLTVAFRDLNGYGAPDLYVCNDFQTEDRIWLNDGHGFFRMSPPYMFRHVPSFSMSVDVADINRDGFFDLFAADMLSRNHSQRLMQLAQTAPYQSSIGIYADRPQFDRNTLQLNRGDTTYADIAPFAGLAETEWTWSGAFLDVDLDGFEDLLCTTSHMFDTQDLDTDSVIRAKGPWPREKFPLKLLLHPRMMQPKQAFRNRGDLTFEDAAAVWGFNQVGVAQGMAFADLDNDGDLDLVVNNLNGATGLYRNNSAASRVAIRLKGNPPNTEGIGAKVSLIAYFASPESEATPVRFVQSQEICAGGRYLSSDEPIRVFAGDVTAALQRKRAQAHLAPVEPPGPVQFQIEVIWRSGRRSVVDNVMTNQLYEIAEQGSEAPSGKPAQPPATLFEDVSARLNHRHREEVYDDSARQPLLPRKLGQCGPGVAWFDFDNDGHEDLVLTSGRGGRIAAFRNDGHGGFSPLTNTAFTALAPQDQTCALGARRDNTSELFVGLSNHKDARASDPVLRTYDLANGKINDSFPSQESSTGPLALADVNGDGTLDLFVGGRSIPGKWPSPASSLLFLSRGGEYVLDLTNNPTFANLGLVSGATFADLNGDGWPDLVLACEWGPLRVFLNDHGHFRDATAQLGLDAYVGWWNGVTVGDFDGDGQLDIAASNWGLNGGASGYDRPALIATTSVQNQPGVPLLYWGDFTGNQGLDLIEAEYDSILAKVVPTRPKPAIETGLPFLSARFPTFAAYNIAGVVDLLGSKFLTTPRLAAPWLASTLFLNRKGKFQPVVLPPEAQFSPAFGICVADFDGDGNEDLFLAQNFFGVQPEAVRADAGRGILLRGNGHGDFDPMPGQVSGIAVYGEGRGAAVGDFDEDGRPDLAVGQNGADTKLYRNTQAKPGLRVRLEGPPANPQAIGAVLRLKFGDRFGPAREIHTGSGYWSQDSAVQVLATPQPPTQIWIRWPGGKITTTDLPPAALEIAVNVEGQVRQLR